MTNLEIILLLCYTSSVFGTIWLAKLYYKKVDEVRLLTAVLEDAEHMVKGLKSGEFEWIDKCYLEGSILRYKEEMRRQK